MSTVGRRIQSRERNHSSGDLRPEHRPHQTINELSLSFASLPLSLSLNHISINFFSLSRPATLPSLCTMSFAR